MKLSELLLPVFEKIDLRPGADSKYPTKKFNYDEWKRLSKKFGDKKPTDKKPSVEKDEK